MQLERRHADDVVRGRGDFDSGLAVLVEDVSRDPVFQRANVVRAADKPRGELDPVVGQPEENSRPQFIDLHEVSPL